MGEIDHTFICSFNMKYVLFTEYKDATLFQIVQNNSKHTE